METSSGEGTPATEFTTPSSYLLFRFPLFAWPEISPSGDCFARPQSRVGVRAEVGVLRGQWLSPEAPSSLLMFAR